MRRQTIVQSRWLAVHEDDYVLPDGTTLERYHTIEEPDGVSVVALTEDDTAVMVRQFRPAIGREIVEFPAGLLEPDDAEPLARARQELLEEIGYASDRWIATGHIEPMPNRARKVQHCFVALDAFPVQRQALDAGERIEIVLVPLRDLEGLTAAGEFTCATCIASLALARPYLPAAAAQQ